MDNKQELINKICDLSKKLGHTEGLLQRKTEMLDKCDKRFREMRQNNSLLMMEINKNIKEYQNLLDEITGEYNKHGELSLNPQTSYLQGVIRGLSIALDLLVGGVDNNEN